jgi:hypothetical protein
MKNKAPNKDIIGHITEKIRVMRKIEIENAY